MTRGVSAPESRFTSSHGAHPSGHSTHVGYPCPMTSSWANDALSRTQLLVGDLAEHADWQDFYDTYLQRDFSNTLSMQTMALPTSELVQQMQAALQSGHTRDLTHWCETAHRSGFAAIGPLDEVYADSSISLAKRARKIIAAHAVLLSLSGTALVYLRDLLGLALLPSPTLNQIRHELADAQSLSKRLYDGITRLVRARESHPAFATDAAQQALALTEGVVCIARTAAQTDASPLTMQSGRVVCLANLSPEEQLVSVDWRALLGTRNAVRDLLNGTRFNVHGPSLALQAYQVMWVTV